MSLRFIVELHGGRLQPALRNLSVVLKRDYKIAALFRDVAKCGILIIKRHFAPFVLNLFGLFEDSGFGHLPD